MLLEKQLQASIEGHITRTVESFTYTGGDAESGCSSSRNARVYVNAKLLLLHTLERMRIANGKKSFKRFLLADVSCTLFEEVFWLAFCHFYQKVRASSASQRRPSPCLPWTNGQADTRWLCPLCVSSARCRSSARSSKSSAPSTSR